MKKGLVERQKGAYERLLASKFFPKGKRTEESWLKTKEKTIANLEKKLNITKK